MKSALFIRFCRLVRATNLTARLHLLLALLGGTMRFLMAFLRRNRAFADALFLGLVAFLILGTVPVIGHLLAVLALAAASVAGLFRHVKQAVFGRDDNAII